ncbi:MAG: nucleotide sugar dehydrogenase [Chloroflexi bacterium]|nr:nucleotide sugar dehydrogenase [Chloroflexota bacterium]
MVNSAGPHDPLLPRQLTVIGLGYVGLPLAAAFGRVLPTVGFDISKTRVAELQAGSDRNRELTREDLSATYLSFTSTETDITESDFFIVAVPTPVDASKRPDLTPLVSASEVVGRAIARRSALRSSKEGAGSQSSEPTMPIVVYESTVYPGCTEEDCVPVVQRASGQAAGVGFKVGYSPERINPGDPDHTLAHVTKVVSGQDSATLERVAATYGLVVKAGVYRAPDIRTAEAAKVIENTQRDQNIALMNELSMLFHQMGMDSREVFQAARTKWNFLPFEPGLVGGHCIPVDPYYLAHKAQEIGFHTEMVLAGRRTNDSMARYVAIESVRLLTKARRMQHPPRVLVMGLTFKENVPDVRNTQVVPLIAELQSWGAKVAVYDPLVDDKIVRGMGFEVASNPFLGGARYDGLVIATAHAFFRKHTPQAYLGLLSSGEGPGVLVDVKGILRDAFKSGEVFYWAL